MLRSALVGLGLKDTVSSDLWSQGSMLRSGLRLANKRKFEILGTVGSSQQLALVGQLKVGSVGWGRMLQSALFGLGAKGYGRL
jgi:hypothetical protein